MSGTRNILKLAIFGGPFKVRITGILGVGWGGVGGGGGISSH